MMLTDFHFLRPNWLWFLPLLILLGIILSRLQKNSHAWQQVCDPHLLRYLLIQPKQQNQQLAVRILWFILLLALLALAGPSWQKTTSSLYQNKQAMVFILDCSQSMLAKDLQPSRLTQAKRKIRDILKL